MLKINSLISFLILLLVAGMGEVRAQNGPTGGTSITNMASTTFNKLGATTLEEIISNEVNVVVDATINFSLELENSIKRFRGDKVEFDHFLVNNGNVASTFDIKIYNWDQGEYDLENLEWISGNKSR
ncbi:MAG TPA: hypothetical protein DCL80_05810, partial [Balneola sp.]|nr:hypothetical protein [Balneola sp.]